MKVTLTQYGGHMAGMRLPPRVVDSATLSESAAEELKQLVAAAHATPVATEERPGRARDSMGYTISVEGDGETTNLRQTDTAMSPAFAALLTWLQQQG